jgi:outer membrane murein-binding lipoprotein Lpp
MEAIITAIITGGLALVGVIISNISSNRKIEQQLATAQAVTEVKIQTLTDEVRKHNGFAERVPVLEIKVDTLSKRVDQMEVHCYDDVK